MSELDANPGLSPDSTLHFDDETSDVSDISWADAPIFAVFWILIVVVFAQFFSRYALNDSITWTEEVARYLLVVVGFSGSIICARKNSHIYLDFLHMYLPEKASRIISWFTDLISLAFFAYAAWIGVNLAQQMTNRRMVSLDVSLSMLFWIVAACLALTALTMLFRLVKRARA